jgi:hypothetical protein
VGNKLNDYNNKILDVNSNSILKKINYTDNNFDPITNTFASFGDETANRRFYMTMAPIFLDDNKFNSFVTNLNNIKNITSYYVVNNYLQEKYIYFIERLFLMIDRMVKDKKYNFYNGVHKPHRLKCYELIKNNNLLNEGYFSYADFAFLSKNDDDKTYFMDFLDMKTEDECNEYLSNFEIPLLYDTLDSDPNVFVAFAIPPQTSMQSYISITTETFFQDNDNKDLIFSEKSFKPFYGFNIPLIIGQPTGLKYLKDLGFDLFEDLFEITTTYNKNELFEQLNKNLEKIYS